jgi:hypothetical protein
MLVAYLHAQQILTGTAPAGASFLSRLAPV